jgi:hypothetical protein
MGGRGSGCDDHWWRAPKKGVVEDCLRLDVNRWARRQPLRTGILADGAWEWMYRDGNTFTVHYRVDTLDPGNPFVRLWYSWVDSSSPRPQHEGYRVGLTATRPHLGGHRGWFVCPLEVDGCLCLRRVGKLYLPPGGRCFGCRHCHGLTYTSCQESHTDEDLYERLAKNMGCDAATARRRLREMFKQDDPLDDDDEDLLDDDDLLDDGDDLLDDDSLDDGDDLPD